jgi:NADH-quinone oxidoreductase subunit J
MAPQQLILDEPIKQLSLTLFRDFLLPFEMASVILLVALIGAVVLARSDESRKQKQQTTEEEAP